MQLNAAEEKHTATYSGLTLIYDHEPEIGPWRSLTILSLPS